MASTLYRWLMDRATGDEFDAHLLACSIAARCDEGGGDIASRLGLATEELREIMQTRFSGADLGMACGNGPKAVDYAPEEEDLILLLLDFRAGGAKVEEWLAAITARACLRPDHLWQDMGLDSRNDVTLMMRRHFPGLAELNARDMKWKKFLYKQLCDREDIRICKSPNCEDCDDHDQCFGPEERA